MSTDKYTTSEATTTVLNGDYIPCVQYGFPDSPVREPKLRTIFEPVPEGANTASPIYFLTTEKYKWQRDFDDPYNVRDYKMLATQIQDRCENEDRVLYPIHIESDAYHVYDSATLIEWFRGFVEDSLNVPFDSCTLYFSGKRSIHVHVPRFVSGEDQREQLKELAETFCEETGAELDCGLYGRKRLFRLPGVKHQKTGLHKVEIDSDWDKTRIFRESNTYSVEVPESYEEVLRKVFFKDALTVDSFRPSEYTSHKLFHVLDSEKTVLKIGSTEQPVETPLIEQRVKPEDPVEAERWQQYNSKEFSPYALASGGERSVAVVQVKGGAFARKDVRKGAALIPAHFYGAQSCAGNVFTKDRCYSPLQLSKEDYRKWVKRGITTGDNVVIIGGNSGSSVILTVDSTTAITAGYALHPEHGSREKALMFLKKQGFDVGSAGPSGSAPRRVKRSQSPPTRVLPAVNPRTEAEKFQQRAEQQGIQTLSHNELWKVAARLLRIYKWELTWDWFREQFGPAFNPDETWRQLKGIVENYPGDYQDVRVPRQP